MIIFTALQCSFHNEIYIGQIQCAHEYMNTATMYQMYTVSRNEELVFCESGQVREVGQSISVIYEHSASILGLKSRAVH